MIQSRQIEAFRAVMLTGSMTGAAARMNVTQPAVSRLIRDLEYRAGLTLFRRNGNQVSPTAQAEALLEEVERFYVGLDRIEDFARELRQGSMDLIRIVTLPAMSAFLPRFVARFCHNQPGLRVVVDSLHSGLVRDRVASGVFDLGICAAPFSHPGLLSTPLDDDAVAVIPIGHALAARRVIRPEDLAGQDVVVIDKFVEGRHPFELALQSIRLGRVFRTPLCTMACAMAAEGAGIALVDPFSASEFTDRGVVICSVAPAVTIGTAVIRSATRPTPPVLRQFHDAFVAHARSFTRQAAYMQV